MRKALVAVPALLGGAVAALALSGHVGTGQAPGRLADGAGFIGAPGLAAADARFPIADARQGRRVRPVIIHISVDGLRSGDPTRDLQGLIDRGEAPAFAQLQREGLWTHNARTDAVHTNTIPNHSTMLTGRPVEDVQNVAPGHRYRWNSDPENVPTSGVPAPGVNLSTLHTNAGEYVHSVFNVASDAGLSTALYASKSKFSLYDASYDGVDEAGDPPFEQQGADRDGEDDGPDKIDHFVYEGDIRVMTDRFLADIAARGIWDYSFLHFRAPDSAGHGNGWGSPAYLAAIRATDAQIARILDFLSRDRRLRERAILIVSADHGGGGDRPVTDAQHGTPAAPLNFTIPFYVWGAGVARGDIYAFNPGARANPNPNINPTVLTGLGAAPPIRNGDGGNLALDLLGLGPIPNSSINLRQDLEVRAQRHGRDGHFDRRRGRDRG